MDQPISPRKIIFRNWQSPGDIVMLLYAVTSLHESHPNKFITDVDCPAKDIFLGNPIITPLDKADPAVTVIQAEYPSIHRSNSHPVRFVESFTEHMEEKLGVRIKPTKFAGALKILPEEHAWFSGMHEQIGKDVPYWILNAGHKSDYTAKAWSFSRYQELVSRFPNVWFVQVGAKEHVHPLLHGDNVINFIGRTDTRQLIRLVYNSFGVISGVSFPMHLAYAIPAHPRFGRMSRANITLAGGREPAHWEQGPDHQFLHTCGMLKCCQQGGCWKSRVIPLPDNDAKNQSLCELPTFMEDGQAIAYCMSMITVDDVARQLERYMAHLEYEPKF
jgi:ADP-heptose:LPS heptosyltransferase